MEALLNVYTNEDDSVQKKLTKRAIKLQKKYYKRRKIKEKFIVKKSPLRKAISIVVDTACVLVAVLCGLVCFCNISCRFQNLPPSVGGYMAMQIVSGSMRASGFEIGDSVMVRAVDTDTLKEGDMIAFYVYTPSYQNFKSYTATKLDSSQIDDLKYKVSIQNILGIYNNDIQEAAKANSRRVFHQIIGVYEDSDGVRWFQTKGTSNATRDGWYVKETMVIGAYTNTNVASAMSVVISTMTSSVGTIVVLMIPLVIIAFFVVGLCLKDVYISMLENEIVEEKRKLTDDICVKNGIGFQMSNKTKYKVLATAGADEKLTYIGLLWKDGKEPEAIKKYYIRKRMLIQPLEEKNALNRECEKLFEAGENPREIAKYYEQGCERIDKKYQTVKSKLKSIRETNKALKEEQEKQAQELKNKKSKKKLLKSKENKTSVENKTKENSTAKTDKTKSKSKKAEDKKSTKDKSKTLQNKTSKANIIDKPAKAVESKQVEPAQTKETGVKATTKKPTVNKKSTATDSSSKRVAKTKKPVSKTER